ncbi:glycoside hydrolase superfamily [Flagelloscypha sp. PMI_526]|nr:glycoside hydrolase superfamily [Flagelloscypha sp. PMI_526]
MYFQLAALPLLTLFASARPLPGAQLRARHGSSQLSFREPPTDKKVIVQMFQWSWDSIAAECTAFLGPAGYGFVQTSPPQEHVTGPEWFTDYQPVSYQLISKRGNREQFQNMISTCNAAGVNIIADTVLNHMAGSDNGTGVAGSSFTHFDYPGIYQDGDFHHCGLQPNDDIVDFSNTLEVQTCELVNLADLATNASNVQATLAAYTKDLLSLGVSGFRLDAAKHIPPEDIAAIISQTGGTPYITQEVTGGIGGPQPSDYVQNGDVQEFGYTHELQNAFTNGTISGLQDLESKGFIAGSSANVFVANHDTERNGDSLNSKSPSNTYITATIFSLAHPFGTPTILSSYEFTDINAGAPNAGAGTCSETGGADGWICQHRFIAVSGMVGFRNTVGTAELSNFVSPQGDQIAFGRGTAGFVAINNADTEWAGTFTTSLADGSYCDVIVGKSDGTSCSSTAFTVSGGTFTGTVAPRSAIAIHTGAQGTASA